MDITDLTTQVYEDLNGQITSIQQLSDAILITFVCDDWEAPDSKRQFKLTCEGVREHDLTVGGVGWINTPDSHPLLWAHTNEHASLYFSSKADDPYKIIGRLYETHEQLYGGWRQMSHHVHANASLLEGGYGLIASGPSNVIQAYAESINGLVRANIVQTYSPKASLKAYIFDDHFLICESVRVAEDTNHEIP